MVKDGGAGVGQAGGSSATANLVVNSVEVVDTVADSVCKILLAH